MAKKNSNLDNFFREKLSGYEAPGKKSSWQLMNHLLDARERRKKILKRILFGFFLTGIIFSGYLIFIPGKEKGKTIAGNNINDSAATLSAPAGARGRKNQAGDSGAADTIFTAEKTAAENSSKETANAPGQKQDMNKKITAAEESKAGSVIAGGENEKTSSNPKVKVDRSEKPRVVLQKKTAGTDDKNIEGDAGATVKVSDKKDEETTGEENAKISDMPVDGKTGNSDSSLVNTPAAEVSKAEVNDSVISDSTIVVTTATDSAANSVKDNIKLEANNPRFLTLNLFAGFNLYRTQSRSLTDKRSASLIAGLETVYPLSKRFEAGLGAFYSLQGGYNLADTATQVSYFLERNVSQQIILIRKQHRLYVPLTLYYIISDKHAVSGGLHWSYLLTTVGDYTEMKSISGTTTQSQKTGVKGYMDGISSSALSLAVGYRFSLSKRFDIHARIIQELEDAYTREYFYGINGAPSWSMQTFVSVKF